MATSIDLEPIRNLKPLNKGGVVARGGFCFQDHIAVNFCLEMIVEPRLEEVWCETHDDITLIWCENEVEKVEFVQVKDYDRDTLWSLPRLCQREERREGTSILERSLAEARCQEPCMFRIVTSLGVKDELKILTYDFSSPFRKEHQSEYINLSEKIRGKLGHLISPKGYQVDYWLANTLWQIEHNIGAIYQYLRQNERLVRLYRGDIRKERN